MTQDTEILVAIDSFWRSIKWLQCHTVSVITGDCISCRCLIIWLFFLLFFRLLRMCLLNAIPAHFTSPLHASFVCSCLWGTIMKYEYVESLCSSNNSYKISGMHESNARSCLSLWCRISPFELNQICLALNHQCPFILLPTNLKWQMNWLNQWKTVTKWGQFTADLWSYD